MSIQDSQLELNQILLDFDEGRYKEASDEARKLHTHIEEGGKVPKVDFLRGRRKVILGFLKYVELCGD